MSEMNDAMQRADEVAAMGPWAENTIDGASGVIYDRDGDGWDDMELADAANTLRTGYLARREREAAWEWLVLRYDIRSDAYQLEAGEYGYGGEFDVTCAVSHVNGKPDPVALCDAIDKDWRKA